MNNREFIARRIAQEFKNGEVVNLGVGMPTMVVDYIPENIHIMLQAENGILGVGPKATQGKERLDCIDSGGNYVTTMEGACFFDSSLSFSIIRGGHVDITVLGALEVDEKGNLASWMIPGKKVPGMGGAMDLVVGAKRVIVAMEHVNKNGAPKILEQCKLPLTAVNVVKTIVTEKAVIDVIPGSGLMLKEIAPGLSVEDVQLATEAKLMISPHLKAIAV
ncbi:MULTISPECIES: 3-oxoacid CoA-transferase subunit B [Paenibacillus]|jgi:acetate CoA/acetoacetate CoA-transferase beta subunit|uniref:3-oxoacid CoA-transferase subunit B n=2 Tax=Paenibacillus TaxID=44249 RepID=A0AAJ3J2D5_PAEPO|nr:MULTISPECIES: 3-oxoacid CoA-transferase subunit B [Paenibacillus]AHC18843.1 acetate CoA-transferase [Paenibacillus polymyxa CR1]ALA41134.1 acetate CoA-transferase [Paenibacillus peoriae]APB77090.1 succinyl-CoA--3-ketoacid-CoA transferase [Paenibacillus polymyxa]APQ58413.1 acetate CoA-transferase [Paenibacillus polymyxa]MCP3744348.1 3-oxoacid CoA-transferase subunit B [Paenibacillus sp. A3M_27_13]